MEQEREGWGWGKGKRSREKLQNSQVLRQLNQLSGSQAEQSRARFGRKSVSVHNHEGIQGFSALAYCRVLTTRISSCESHAQFSDSLLSFSHTFSLCPRACVPGSTACSIWNQWELHCLCARHALKGWFATIFNGAAPGSDTEGKEERKRELKPQKHSPNYSYIMLSPQKQPTMRF